MCCLIVAAPFELTIFVMGLFTVSRGDVLNETQYRRLLKKNTIVPFKNGNKGLFSLLKGNNSNVFLANIGRALLLDYRAGNVHSLPLESRLP